MTFVQRFGGSLNQERGKAGGVGHARNLIAVKGGRHVRGEGRARPGGGEPNGDPAGLQAARLLEIHLREHEAGCAEAP